MDPQVKAGNEISVVAPKLLVLAPARLRLSKSFRSGSGTGSDLSFLGTCFHSF
jgi:hypothetical protein